MPVSKVLDGVRFYLSLRGKNLTKECLFFTNGVTFFCEFRVRKEEMLFFLRQAIRLELQENILTIDDGEQSKLGPFSFQKKPPI